MRRVVICMAVLCAGVLLAPATVSAQTGIAGVVRDTTGAVMPGVTVEASSPALIEKSRVAISDSAGQYKIVDLPPGTYAVTFSLAGSRSFRGRVISTATRQRHADDGCQLLSYAGSALLNDHRSLVAVGLCPADVHRVAIGARPVERDLAAAVADVELDGVVALE